MIGCFISFYQKSLQIIRSKIINPRLYIFLDDISSFMNPEHGYLQLLDSYYYEIISNPELLDSLDELELMKACPNIIRSNSTFSWWATFFASTLDKKNGVFISPEKNY